MKKAVILLSGGLDSSTVAAIARSKGFELYALTVDYGQRHSQEIAAAEKVATAIGFAEHKIIRVDLTLFGGSALTDEIEVPKNVPRDEIGLKVPSTYVPGRNTIFLSLALAYAETIGANDIFIGISQVDYSGYPDCREEFVRKFEELADIATRAGTEEGRRFTIHAPLLHIGKAGTIKLGRELGVDYSLTSSCYDPLPDDVPCGTCEACILRAKGFEEAGT